MKKIPLLEIALFAAFVLTLAWFSRSKPEPTATPVPTPKPLPDPMLMSPNYRQSGFTMAEVPPNWGGDSEFIAEMAQIEIWKFVLQVPPNTGTVMVSYELELREKNKAPRSLLKFDYEELTPDFQDRRQWLIVGIMPESGDFTASKRLRVRIDGSSNFIKNPFLGAGVRRRGANSVAAPANRIDLPLMAADFGSHKEVTSKRHIALFLKIRLMPRQSTSSGTPPQ
jgi:hypothetical protein